ncbi:hypothetical protein [Candidatus Hakubella thermalkaliphila]|uniref:hypothetical protein n=1 Tax=Candidatus Hakubella thermalkaliphila TaxID=2754717 RepID=UPI0015935195|nr:hypothetical protein [Candidatus Hakubella thermalkaliphila]
MKWNIGRSREHPIGACSTWNIRRETPAPWPKEIFQGQYVGVGMPSAHRSTIGMERAMRTQMLASKVAESAAYREGEA